MTIEKTVITTIYRYRGSFLFDRQELVRLIYYDITPAAIGINIIFGNTIFEDTVIKYMLLYRWLARGGRARNPIDNIFGYCNVVIYTRPDTITL